ncbi:MAG: 30S ribosomal protein S11 [Mycoplasmataceae bacterium]|nr:30S ribosomal protein S11 [Mycoplasmataceae bacterium]
MASNKVKAQIKKTNVNKKKKKTVKIDKGIVHIHSTTNNTIVSISDINGNVVAWASAGTCGYKGSKKATPYSAGLAVAQACEKAKNTGLKSVIVSVNGTGQGKDTAIRSVDAAGLEITEIQDNTPIPHNGCKPPKKRR